MAENVISRWKDGLSRTRKAAFGRIAQVFGASEISASTWDELEAALIQADIGLEISQSVIESLKRVVSANGITRSDEFNAVLKSELRARLAETPAVRFDQHPAVILVVGVNGSGKTTTIAKLAKQYQDSGKSVLLVAADTFRAAAVDQLQVWADRLRVPIISGAAGGDPGAAAYDGVQAALARKTDIVLIDTAGRLQTRYNLMEELKKVERVVSKALPGAPHASWLVLDATTGQNALQQARAFKDTVKLNGIILAKLDSSARGGMAFAIQQELSLPILYAGLGEKVEDLQPFDREAFVDGILSQS